MMDQWSQLCTRMEDLHTGFGRQSTRIDEIYERQTRMAEEQYRFGQRQDVMYDILVSLRAGQLEARAMRAPPPPDDDAP